MRLKALSLNYGKTMGFVKIAEFDGVTSTFNIAQLNQLLGFLQNFRDVGIETVRIGLEEGGPLLVMFGEDVCFALAPEMEEEEEVDEEE